MDIPVETYTFFSIILSGSITVWTFRSFIKSEKNADFEYICLSAFWGLFIIIFWEFLAPVIPKTDIKHLLQNPFATGAAMSSSGLLFGFLGSHISTSTIFKSLLAKISPKTNDSTITGAEEIIESSQPNETIAVTNAQEANVVVSSD